MSWALHIGVSLLHYYIGVSLRVRAHVCKGKRQSQSDSGGTSF